MRLPRFRHRTLMVAMAVVGLALGMSARRARFQAIAADHKSRTAMIGAGDLLVMEWFDARGRRVKSRQLSQWHAALARKYERAAHYPWLPVAPDPPPPNAE